MRASRTGRDDARAYAVARYLRGQGLTVDRVGPRLFLRIGPDLQPMAIRVARTQTRTPADLMAMEIRQAEGLLIPSVLALGRAPEVEGTTLLMRFGDAVPLLRGKD